MWIKWIFQDQFPDRSKDNTTQFEKISSINLNCQGLELFRNIRSAHKSNQSNYLS